MDSTRITPACSNSACTLASSTATLVAARPAGTACLPLFTTITGLLRATRRARRENLRGFPKLSR